MLMRDIIDGLKDALRTMGASGITGSDAMDAFATAHQLVGRLEANLMEEQRRAAQASVRAARLPRPAVETMDPDTFFGCEIDPTLSVQQVHMALDMAARVMNENGDEKLDEIEAGLDAYLITRNDVRGMASRY